MQIEDSYPLSPVQHGMLIHSLSAPQSGVYVQQLVSVLREVLNVSAFRQAWDLMVSRHAILRTSFVWDGAAEPLQRVHANVSLPFECHDWSRFPVERREELLKGFLIGDRERGFRFDEAPLMRQTLFRYAEAEYRWIWTSHHALLDGRSRLLLLKELFAAYEEILDGRPTNLNGAQSYRNYIDWLNKNDFTVAEGFWRDLLSGFIAPTPLLPERNRPAENSSRTFGKQTLRLSGQVTRRLQSLAREHQLTPNTFFEGAWALLLSLYSGETDVVFGATRAVRHAAVQGVESMVGLLINTVPVRASVSSETLLLPWLKELRDRWVAMRNFEHTSLVKIQQWSEVPAGKPLFESLLVFENYQLNSLMREQGAHWEKRDFNLLGSTHYPLSMAGYLGQDLVLEITYDHHRFDDAAIARMLGQVKVLLEGMVSDPARRLADLPRMTQEECHQLLVEWNDTKRNYPQDLCLHELFERQTERTPDAIAVVFEEKKINYLELNRRANYVAQRLRELGIGPDVFVGICLERSIEMIVALLGILKAGGAYVPLDPAHPKDRLAFILQDSQAAVLLTEERLLDRLPALTTHVVYMDKEMARELESNPDSQVGEDNCAYVIYTSGSTGNPKGVMVEHRSLVNYLCWFNESPLAERLESLPAITTPTFDASLRQLFAPLLRGGQVWIVPNDIVGEPAALLRTLGARSSVGLNCVPSLWQTVLKAIEADHAIVSDNNLSYLILGGEAFNQRLVKKTFAAFPDIIIWNIYGPTETTANASFAVISPGAPISIGRPISNTRIYIRDAFLEPVPIGVTGELHIGGAGLARGYLNRPDLTSEKFIPDPFSGEPGARLYATGDRARFRPDGSIEFLGRLDGQIKLRGFRIELGDIEATLAEHPSVRQAVVLARDNIRGENELQAYVVPQQDGTPTIKDLRSFLKSKLPDYMIPSAFVFLDTLPLTSNGKVDRRALPAPGRPEPENNFVAPRTAIEEILAGIWSRVLNIKQVGIHDNFFEVGGHSLLATRIISRLRDAFQVELSFSALFESPTVAGLAERIEKARRTEQDPAPSLKPVSRSGTLHLSFAQQRLWFMEQLEPGTGVYNLPVAYRLRGPLNLPALEQSLNDIVRRHEALRTTFSFSDGVPVQTIAPLLKVAIQSIDLRNTAEPLRQAEAERLVAGESARTFDLSQGPLLRAGVLQLAEEEHIFFLVLHHSVSDGWSMGVLFRELGALYGARLREKPSPLPDLPVQYADFAVWQRKWLEGAVLQKQLSYWKKQLKNLPLLLELPTDRPRPPVQTFRGAKHTLFIPERLSGAFKALCHREGATLFMLLLTAFNVLLSRYAGRLDIVVGTPVAGRNRIEIEGLIGFFVNTLVLRTDLSGDPRFTHLLRQVREAALQAYDHQDLPFEKLVEELQPNRDLSRSPLVQVMFQVRDSSLERAGLAGLNMEEFEFDFGRAKFDLALHVVEKSDGLSCLFRYNADLFDDGAIRRMGDHWTVLLEGILQNPEQPISELPMLTRAERRELLEKQNARPSAYVQNQGIHRLFEAQVERTPNAVAVIFENQQLTYRELNARANQIAHYLKSLGAGPEARIGICVERSLDMVVGILAILKSGAAYVPLDPHYPEGRLAHMLGESGIDLLLTKERLLETLPEFKGQTLCLDRDRKLFELEPEEDPAGHLQPDSLAYVMYTSGSTGKPKGVLVTHRGVLNYFSYLHETYHLSGADTVLQLPSFSFDASVRDLIGVLTAGARVALVNGFDAKHPAALLSKIKEHSVTCLLSVVPTLLSGLLEAGPSGNSYTSIRLILVSGEALTFGACRKAKEIFPKALLVNQYGPTECTMTSTYHPVIEAESGHYIVPLGNPIPNAQIYILDSHLNPVPTGIAGEVYIGGIGLARGYMNSPELTAERFIPDPFSIEPGARLYKTGDLARCRNGGNTDFLGRIDHQVKVRGFRIELGEIEAAISSHPSVRAAAVVTRNDVLGNPRLVAYVVPHDKMKLEWGELRSLLAESLPDYMVPSAFVLLDSLPMTPNRKVDRRALPDPGPEQYAVKKAFIAPRTCVEAAVADIWRELFKKDLLSVDDNFFQLGGHSLQATQVISRLWDFFQVTLPLRRLFEAPTISGLAHCIEKELDSGRNLPPPQPELLPRSGKLPLSFAQQRLWFLEQLNPLSPLYNIVTAVSLNGPLNMGSLERSFDEIVRRHEVLRTSFFESEGLPFQAIEPSLRLALPVTDLSSVPESDRATEALRRATEEARRPFDLARAPLFRAQVWRLSDQEHVLLVTMHHMISDGWSMEVLFREISVLYQAVSQEKPSTLPELSIQYADFALWQRQWLQGEVLERQIGYWKQHLKGYPLLLELPTDRRRPAMQTFQGAKQRLQLSTRLVERLTALSNDQGSSLFMTLLAAFTVLLSRYTGRDDIVVGSPIANRTRREIEGLIGYFVNTLALRVDLSGNPTFVELLGRARRTALGAYEHQDMPFEKLVDELKPERDLSYNPLFQVMFLQMNDSVSALQIADVTVKNLRVDRGASKFDLSVAMVEEKDRLRVVFEYNTDLWDHATIKRMSDHYQTLLESIAANPGRRLSDLGMLTEGENRQILIDWNDTRRSYPNDESIQQLFEAQASRSPDAVAVVFENGKLTYRELNQRANQLAHYLQSLGVGPEVLVGICMEHSLEMLVGLLGILKAGGAYVPLDPAYPPERIAFIAEDNGMRLLLTQEKLVEDLRRTGHRVIAIESLEKEMKRKPRKNLAPSTKPKNLAYAIYTSGSTGKPKGVQIEHKALVNFLHDMRQKIAMSDRDILLAVTTVSFDIAALELFLPLIVGARVVLASREVSSDGRRLREELENSKATVMQATPATWRMLLEAGWKGVQGLKILCGGDALSPDLAKPLLERGGVVWNLYGPTETTVWSAIWQVDPHYGRISVGRPIANTQVYILDRNLEPVPVGVAGELHFGGDGVARGYLDLPELTAEKFIPNPFSNDPGARLYKTGDLARYLPDGNIEFLGRVDHQVKIRGFRIELGEIEAMLSHHPGVRESAVIAREDGPGERQLAAYIVPDRKLAPTIGELRSFLRQKLPEYMIPSAFVYLESLPLTANGKVDRQALPPPDRTRPELDSAFMPPRNPAEEALAGIWREVLKIARVGIHDNFFELGGHSLVAIQVISRVRQAFHIDLPLRCLFETPTVSGLAERIERGRGEEQGLQTPPLLPIPRNGALPLSFAQQRLWFLNQFEPGSSVYNIHIALRLCGQLNIAALEQSLDKIQRRHEAIRTSFVAVDGRPLQVIAPPSTLKLPVIDLRGIPETGREAEAQRLGTEEGRRPFDLTQSPLWRVALLQLREHEHILLITLHHIVGDAWSKGVIYRELSALYQDFSTGQSPRLPELPIQYVDYAHWQRQWLQGKALDVQLSYWKQKLGGNLPALELPTDHPRPPIKTYRGARQTLVVSKYVFEMLNALSQREGVSLFMTLLAAFEILLYRYTRQEDILVGTPIAGRNRTEVEGLIGFFLNNLVLRADLSGRPTYRELLGRVREVALGAYAHQDLPFEKLLEEIKLERDLSHTPLFRVFFNMHHIPDNKMEIPGVKVEMLSFRRQVSHFDLTLYVLDHAEGIELALSYNADLFEPARMIEMLRQFEHLLSQIVQNPDESIDRFSLVTPSAERYLPNPAQPLDSDWKGAVHAQFSLQAQKNPQLLAVSDPWTSWTYQELDSRSNRIANYLRDNDIKPHDIVAIYGHRSAPLVSAVMGILKAGAAFVILDPAYPAARLLDCLQVAKPRGWLQIEAAGAVPQALEEFIATASLRCRVQLPQNHSSVEPDFLGEHSADNPGVVVEADDIAYVAFTSGSTGQPKGILGRHGPLSHFLPWQEQVFDLSASDRFSMLSGLSHDPLQREIFTPLWLGATLCIPDPQIIGTSKLADWMAEEQVTFAHLTPAMAQLLTGTAASECRMPSLHYAFFVGDKLAQRDVSRLRRLAPKATCITSYGTTETQRSVGYYPVPPETELQDNWDKAIYPLGRGIDGVQLLVLTDEKILAGVGELGEIYVRSPHLAKGYLGDEALTQARFLTNPFAGMACDRLYRTGDLGRYLPDGNVQFDRRADNQVKIRGFRIELEEIEAVLGQHPEVRECVVTTPQEVSGEERLLAYVVPSREAPPAIHELRNFLRQKLPDYMVPASFLFLSSLPLTPNGKLDREALPALDQNRPELESEFVAPRNPTEETLARIWAEVLNLPRIGIHDDFFDLGGHSLKAMMLASRITAAMKLDISVKSIFSHPTIAELAAALADLDRKGNGSQSIEVKNENQKGNHQLFTEENSSLVTIEHRSLLSLIAAGKIAPVDAVALGYLSDERIQQAGLTREAALADWCDNLPSLNDIVTTPLGRIGIIVLPRFRSELYKDQEGLAKRILEAMEVSKRIGARAISMMGLLPSATDYGRAVTKAFPSGNGPTRFTTGHATTVTAVVLTIKRILEEGGRDLRQEHVAYLGMGSIGYASLRLMLHCMPHPKTLAICDVYDKQESLNKLRREIIDDFKFEGSVEIIGSRGRMPRELYDAGLIVGATNVPNVLDIGSLKPGTLIVDDSAPHCFSSRDAVARFEAAEDILFCEGGALQQATPIRRVRYLPRRIEAMMNRAAVESFSKRHPFYVGGCALASLLLAKFENLPATIGLIDDQSCRAHYELVDRLGYRAAGLHCEEYILPAPSIQNFRRRFGAVKGDVLP